MQAVDLNESFLPDWRIHPASSAIIGAASVRIARQLGLAVSSISVLPFFPHFFFIAP
ncbi:MAG: hypothetical protein IPK05_08025 [Comamonadaceae bacterium]|jgi:hypothetical protein|nr:hypothetical protein [Comamonadaceae bacterium]